MMKQQFVDHLFRHHYGKMVSILTRIFGLSQLETIEDAIQDTFVKALLAWRNEMPENPEAWLTKAAKNRAIDLLRKIKSDKDRVHKVDFGPASMFLNDLFLEPAMEDSQLRMIFAACHPVLNPGDQLSFALKTVSGFGIREIASALLLKEDTIKKRLSRARKSIASEAVTFEIPTSKELPGRLKRVLEVIYLTFNEGFHSNNKKILIRHELCGEAVRLCQLLLKNESMRTSSAYALFALMCFHSARLPSRENDQQELLDLKSQDRSKWHFPLIHLGNSAMNKAVESGVHTAYHFEAAIAGEHLKAKSFESTNWKTILSYYDGLYQLRPTSFTLLNKAIVLLQLNQFDNAKTILDSLNPNNLEQRAYLYYGSLAEYHFSIGQKKQAIKAIDKAIQLVNNTAEKNYLTAKKARMAK